jgi:hypothetical protein
MKNKINDVKFRVTMGDVLIEAVKANIRMSKDLKVKPNPLSYKVLEKYGIDHNNL